MSDEATIERVARAIYEAGIPKGGKYYHTWDDLESEGFYAQHYLAMKQASAAIAALQPQDGLAQLRELLDEYDRANGETKYTPSKQPVYAMTMDYLRRQTFAAMYVYVRAELERKKD